METFEKLSAINVNERTEKKGQLTYLSWAWAWTEFKKALPDATYVIWRDEAGNPFTGNTETGYMVYTSVTANGETHEMWLPVMDFKNKALLNATMTDINKTIMRCLTKNLAMFGLGLYIYAGEDLPEEDDKELKRREEENKLMKYKGAALPKIEKYDIMAISQAFEESGYTSEADDKATATAELVKQVNSKAKLDSIGKRVKELHDEIEKSNA